MTVAAVGLVGSYVALAVLLLSLNLRSAWRWPVKAAAIGVTASFFVIAFLAVLGLLGWPTDAAPPGRFRLHAALVREPDRAGRSAGAIYLWLSPRNEDGEAPESPRAYAMPYSRKLHEQTARAQGRLEAGQGVEGRTQSQSGWSGRFTSHEARIELFAPPSPSLPPKAGLP
jgi:hypothetical protein